MSDPTEEIRRLMVDKINSKPAERDVLEAKYGKDNVWDTDDLQRDFKVLGFMAPFCAVERKSDGVKGTLTFQHMPRFYFDFVEDKS